MKSSKKNKINSLTRFEHHPTISIIIVNGFLFILFLIFLEISLRTYAPIGFTNVGYLHSPNGLKYGWGFSPNDVVRIENPDTGKVFYDRVNNNGWRDRNRSYSNTRNSFRVIVIGDSEVFGYIVPKEKTYTFLLEEKFKKKGKNVEIINIAYSGWGTSQQLEVLGKEATKYNPDLVIIHFVGNDLYDNVGIISPIGSDSSFCFCFLRFSFEIFQTETIFLSSNEKKKRTRLTAEAVQSLALSLQRVDDIHGGDRLSSGVFGVRNRITDNVFQEHLQDTSGFFVD